VDKTKPFDISKQAVWQAYRKVAANAGAAGIDPDCAVGIVVGT
jgi:RNA-directed DNA polymerase